MKTLDEVIEGLGSPYYNTFKKFIKEAVAYLKQYRSDKLQWEREKDDMQSRYQEAIDNCEQAENRFKAALKKLDIGTLNNPLTWDELKTMEGKPVWVDLLSEADWFLLDAINKVVAVFRYRNGLPSHLEKADMGKTWQAYRKERS